MSCSYRASTPTSSSAPTKCSISTSTASSAKPQSASVTSQGASTVSLNGGSAGATNNIINKVADKEKSLFQICLNLQQRLKALPDFGKQLAEEEKDADADTDPVTLLWRTFRRGYPLMTIYNALKPEEPLQIDQSKITEMKWGKAATFRFLQACINNFGISADELFIVTDLYGNDTTGFVKVAKVVNRVLDLLVDQGVLGSEDSANSTTSVELAGGKRTIRQHIISELMRTERTYVQHLKYLQDFKILVEEKGIISEMRFTTSF